MHFLATAPAQTADAVTALRLSLHVLAATIWVGGQFVVAGLLPTLRGMGDDAPRKIARAFSLLAWPAFGVLIITGIWNFAAINHSGVSNGWNAAFGIKMTMVLVSGVGVFLHTRATAPRARGIFAGVGALASIIALVLGVVISG
jgi:putative copper export protein